MPWMIYLHHLTKMQDGGYFQYGVFLLRIYIFRTIFDFCDIFCFITMCSIFVQGRIWTKIFEEEGGVGKKYLKNVHITPRTFKLSRVLVVFLQIEFQF
jgi:hypothetical protein